MCSRTTTSAPASADAGSPTCPRATSAALSGQSWTRAVVAAPSSAETTGGSVSYSTVTSASASASRSGVSATTTAIGSPT
jgi:hypothetical protein